LLQAFHGSYFLVKFLLLFFDIIVFLRFIFFIFRWNWNFVLNLHILRIIFLFNFFLYLLGSQFILNLVIDLCSSFSVHICHNFLLWCLWRCLWWFIQAFIFLVFDVFDGFAFFLLFSLFLIFPSLILLFWIRPWPTLFVFLAFKTIFFVDIFIVFVVIWLCG